MKEKDFLDKKFHDVLLDSSVIVDQPREVISFSPTLDLGLGGGVPTGIWMSVAGLPKHGKTTSVLHFAAQAQKTGREIYYSDIEARLKSRDLKGIKDLDLDKFHIIRSVKGHMLSAEDHLMIAEKILHSKPGCIYVIDSISAMCPKAELTAGMDEQQMGLQSRLAGKFCRKLSDVVSVNDCIVIAIHHLGANLSGYGSKYLETGGLKVTYQADVRLRIKMCRPWRLSQDGKEIGKLITWEILCSPLGPPVAKVESCIRYGTGIDEVTEIIDLASDVGLIQHGGSWYSIGEEKFQGKEKIYNHLVEHPDVFNNLKSQIREMING